MGESKHTPGPWGWTVHDYSTATLMGHPDSDGSGLVMGVSPCGACQECADPKEWKWGRCTTPTEANARLIAAAPDLLAALKDLLGDTPFAFMSDGWRCNHCGREYDNDDGEPPMDCSEDCPGEIARRVIAKAEGR